MEGNADYIASFLLAQGWTLEAISGTLGNMQVESTINPGIWQNLDAGNTALGFGLVQWTPATKYFDWCDTNNLSPYGDMDNNLARILYEVQQNIQWIHPSMTFYDFTQWTGTVYEAGVLFVNHYERPANPDENQRGTLSENWYTYLTGNPPPPYNPPTDDQYVIISGRRYFRRRR